MAKSKRAPALLEVMQRQQAREAGLPRRRVSWWKGQASPPDEPPAGQAAAASGPEPPSAAPDDPPAPEAPPPAPAEPAAAPLPPATPTSRSRRRSPAVDDDGVVPPILSLDEGRVTISLNPVSTVVAVGGILLAIFAGYVVGLLVGRSHAGPVSSSATLPPDDPLAAAAEKPSNPAVLEVGSAKKSKRSAAPAPVRSAGSPALEAAASPPVAGGDPRKPGLNYLVLMDFQKSRGATAAEATAAQQFLLRHNVRAVLDAHRWGWRLWDASRGYTAEEIRTKKAEIEARQAHLRRLGQAYTEQGGRYLFDPYRMLYNPR